MTALRSNREVIQLANEFCLNIRGAESSPPNPGPGPCQACCDVHAVAEDVVILDHDVADIDADAELDAPICGHISIALGHASLHLSRTAQRIHHTTELDEQAVACRLDAPAVLR